MSYLFCFDIDGTLLSTKGAGSRSFRKAILSLFDKEPCWDKITMAGQLDPGIFKTILSEIQIPYEEKLWLEFKKLYLTFLEEETKNSAQWVVFEGVKEILQTISDKKYKPVLLTGNIWEGAWLKLKTIGIEQFFDWEKSIFAETNLEQRKELAYILENKKNSQKPVIIGDTPHDIEVGKIVNGITIAVSTGVHSQEELEKYNPDYLIASLKDFPKNLLSS